jgi:hypothetical protein
MSADIKEQREQIRTDLLISRLIERDAALQETLCNIGELLARLGAAHQVPATLDGDQVAAMFHVAPGTVDNWVSRDKIPYRKANGKVFFLLDELMAWTKPERKK